MCCTGARLSLCFMLWGCICVGRFHVSLLLVPCLHLMFRHCMLYIDKFYSILTQVLSLLAVLTIWAIVAHGKCHGMYGCVVNNWAGTACWPFQ